MFATFCSFREVQQEQIKHMQDEYMGPAIKTARMLGLASELGLALCFDIHVQDGGIKHTAQEQIHQQSGRGTPEPDLRTIVANAVAGWSNPAWRDDVRRRKLAIATGQGVVHGHNYILTNWGLAEFPPSDLLAARRVDG